MLRNSFHRQVPEANYFENNLGLIITDAFDSITQNYGREKVVEKSTFFVVIGQKIRT